jgi:glycerol uptake facilitator-like aquaporin
LRTEQFQKMIVEYWRALQNWYAQSDPPIIYRMFAEFTGCMMFHFIGSVAPTPVANGIALIVIVYYTAKVSGAHLNPAVSLTFCLLGHTNPLEMVLYWIAQVAGCAVGALWIAALIPQIYVRDGRNYAPIDGGIYHDGCFVPSPGVTDSQVFGWEATCSFCFIAHIFSVVWYTQMKKGYGNTGPLIVGLSLFANALAAGSFTGAALNPARVLGSPMVYDCPYKKVHFYILGEFAGAIVATLAIIPWYGISSTPWYGSFVPHFLKTVATRAQQSIILTTLEKKKDHQSHGHTSATFSVDMDSDRQS